MRRRCNSAVARGAVVRGTPLAFMSPACRYPAARNALAALLTAQALIAPIVLAENEAQLILPLMSAMAFGVAAAEATREQSASVSPSLTATPPPRRGAASLLPHRVSIPS